VRDDDARPPAVAIVEWSHVIEDFLGSLGLTFEQFRRELSGGWLFGYVEALRRAGVRAVVVCVSGECRVPTRHVHEPTGATLWTLPAPAGYRALRRRVANPYAETVEQAAGNVRGANRLATIALWRVAPYLATPPRALADVLRAERCSAILCQDYEHGRFDVCLVLGRLLGIPAFASFQGGDRGLSPLEDVPRGLSVRAAAGLVIGPRREAERVRARYGVPPERIARIYNPLDLDEWRRADRADARAALGIPADAGVVAWHGRVEVRRKGLDVLLDAWARVVAERPGRDLRLLVMGTGNDADDFAARAEGIPGVHWRREYVRDRGTLARHLAAADAYAFTSRREGFPVAPVEAMAAGVPLVAVDAEGIPDIVGDAGSSGCVVVGQEDAAALARALGGLLDDPSAARASGARARARAEARFGLDRVGEQLKATLFGPRPVPSPTATTPCDSPPRAAFSGLASARPARPASTRR
jgi:starch synthase